MPFSSHEAGHTAGLTRKQTLKQWLQMLLFDNEPTPELLAILIVYFAQGILQLTFLAASFLLKDELGVSPAQAAALSGLIVLPWTLKILWGFLSDAVPIFGYRRRSYLLLSGLVGTLALVGLGTIVQSLWAALMALILQAWAIAVSDVIADSLVAERARQESVRQVGSLQSLCWATSAVGGILAAYLGGLLLQLLGVRLVFLIAACFPLCVAAATVLVQEQPSQRSLNKRLLRVQGRRLKQAIANRQIWLPAIFILIWQATPSADSAFFFFSTNELGFEPEFLGRVQLATSMAGLAGVWLFQRFFKAVSFRRIFGWTIVIATLLSLTSLILVTHTNRAWGISDQWFSLSDGVILAAAGKLAHMPFFVMAARLCPPGIEATLFALLMSIHNLGMLLSSELGGGLTQLLGVTETDFTNLWLLVLLTSLSSLLPLPFLGFLPSATVQEQLEQGGPSGSAGSEQRAQPEVTVTSRTSSC